MPLTKTKYYEYKTFADAEHSRGNHGQVSTQLMRMYRTAKNCPSPVILELGTGKGQSTTVFLQERYE